MCNSFKDTHQQLALTGTHARPAYNQQEGTATLVVVPSCRLFGLSRIEKLFSEHSQKALVLR